MNQVHPASRRNAGHRFYDGSALYHANKLKRVSPQAKLTYELLKRDGHVTRLTAMNYGIANVTARITELRREGIAVDCAVSLDANGNEYGRWFLRA